MSDTQALITQHSTTVFKRLLMGKATERTREAYADDLRSFASFLQIEPVDDDHPLASVPDEAWADLDTAHIAAYLEHLKTTTSPKTGRPYSTATIARRMTAVRELLTEATYLGFYPRDRLEYLKERLSTPEVTHEHHAGISPDEQARLLEAADALPGLKGVRDYALFRLWLDTGLRRAEIASLKVRDLVVVEGIPTLVIRHGKGDRTRKVGLESYTAYVVQDWLKESGQAADHPIFCQVRKGGRGVDAVYRVVNPDVHLSGSALWKLVKWYCVRAGIASEVTPHSFRVAMVTDMLDGGAPLQHVQAVGGWTTAKMITEIYDRNQYSEPVARYRKKPLPRREVNGNIDNVHFS
jgi:site-specific recombinase XerD